MIQCKTIIGWGSPYDSADTYPSLLIAACNYAQGAKDWKWARTNHAQLAAWGRRIFAMDHDGNGLIEYPSSGNYGDRPSAERRPANWWDTINFGHELGIRRSSAQITTLYRPEELVGTQVICCVNLTPLHIGSVTSEVRILGTDSEQGVVLLQPTEKVKNGDRVF